MGMAYNPATFTMEWVPGGGTYNPLPDNPLGLTGDVAAYYKAVQPNLSAYYAPGDGSFTPGGNVDIQEGTAKSVLGAHGVNTSGMSLEQLKQAATSFMNNKDWWTSPQAAQMAREGIERGNSGNLWADTLQGGLMVGGAALGINSLLGSGLSGLFSGAGNSALSAADMAGGLLPEFGSNAAYSAGLGSTGGNMFELGDLTDAWSNAFGEGGGWNPLTDGYGMGDAASTAAGYGQSMATAAELAQMQAQYPDWYNALTGVTDIGVSPSNIWNAFKTATGAGGASGGTDWLKTLGSLGAAGLGAYASNQQTNALEQQAQRYEGYGAPYRQKLSDLYKDPTSFLSSPEVRVPVDQGTQSLMRSLSTQGNPFGSGNALQQGQSYASDQLFGKLGQEKDRLAGFGGLSSYNQAAPQASTNAINSSSNAWNAVGAGANNIFNPPQTQAQTMAEWAKAMRGGV